MVGCQLGLAHPTHTGYHLREHRSPALSHGLGEPLSDFARLKPRRRLRDPSDNLQPSPPRDPARVRRTWPKVHQERERQAENPRGRCHDVRDADSLLRTNPPRKQSGGPPAGRRPHRNPGHSDHARDEPPTTSAVTLTDPQPHRHSVAQRPQLRSPARCSTTHRTRASVLAALRVTHPQLINFIHRHRQRYLPLSPAHRQTRSSTTILVGRTTTNAAECAPVSLASSRETFSHRKFAGGGLGAVGQWLVVTISRPTWTPVSFAAAVADLAAGRVSLECPGDRKSR